MNEPTYFTLAALLDGPLHGYGIVKRAAELSDGRLRIAPARSTVCSTGCASRAS